MDGEFHSPSWDAPLDVDRELEAIPPGATMKGMFIAPMLAEAQQRGIRLEAARGRYLPFADYPLVEHARVLAEAAGVFYPELTMRRALRRLGRAAQHAFAGSTIGKVVWASVDGADAAVDAIVKSYAIAVPAARVSVMERSPGRARVRLSGGALCFLDSNHVGTFEGVLRTSNEQGEVAVRLEPPSAGEFLLTWPVTAIQRPSR